MLVPLLGPQTSLLTPDVRSKDAYSRVGEGGWGWTGLQMSATPCFLVWEWLSVPRSMYSVPSPREHAPCPLSWGAHTLSTLSGITRPVHSSDDTPQVNREAPEHAGARLSL